MEEELTDISVCMEAGWTDKEEEREGEIFSALLPCRQSLAHAALKYRQKTCKQIKPLQTDCQKQSHLYVQIYII